MPNGQIVAIWHFFIQMIEEVIVRGDYLFRIYGLG